MPFATETSLFLLFSGSEEFEVWSVGAGLHGSSRNFCNWFHCLAQGREWIASPLQEESHQKALPDSAFVWHFADHLDLRFDLCIFEQNGCLLLPTRLASKLPSGTICKLPAAFQVNLAMMHIETRIPFLVKGKAPRAPESDRCAL